MDELTDVERQTVENLVGEAKDISHRGEAIYPDDETQDVLESAYDKLKDS